MRKQSQRVFCIFLILFLLFLNPCFASPSTVLNLSSTHQLSDIGMITVPAGIEFKEALPISETNVSLSQWDLTAMRNDRWHYARIITYRDDKERKAIELFDTLDLKEPLLGMITAMSKAAIEKTAKTNGVKVLKWNPVQKSIIANHDALLFSGQLILSDKFPLPMNCSLYVFSQEKHFMLLAFLSPDSDRDYWQPIFKQMAASLTPG